MARNRNLRRMTLGMAALLIACGGESSGPENDGPRVIFAGTIRDTMSLSVPDSISVRIDGRRINGITNGVFVTEVEAGVETELSITIPGYAPLVQTFTLLGDTAVRLNLARLRPAMITSDFSSSFVRAIIYVPSGWNQLVLGDETTSSVWLTPGSDSIFVPGGNWGRSSLWPTVGEISINEGNVYAATWTLVDSAGNRAVFVCDAECTEQ